MKRVSLFSAMLIVLPLAAFAQTRPAPPPPPPPPAPEVPPVPAPAPRPIILQAPVVDPMVIEDAMRVARESTFIDREAIREASQQAAEAAREASRAAIAPRNFDFDYPKEFDFGQQTTVFSSMGGSNTESGLYASGKSAMDGRNY